MTHDDPGLDRLGELIATSPHNLVSRGERARVASVHIPEARAVAALLPARPGERWLDLGTGGGLPGLVLARCLPATHWVLLDSTQKKVDAVASFAEELGLANVTPLCARAEEAARRGDLRGALDGVVARAVAPLRVLAELADARRALDVLGWAEPAGVPLPGAVRPTWLVTMRARGAAPRRFPRRSGLPARKPL